MRHAVTRVVFPALITVVALCPVEGKVAVAADEEPRTAERERERDRDSDRGPGRRGPPPRMHDGMPRPGMPHDRSGMLHEIADRLARIERKIDAAPRMENPWSPRRSEPLEHREGPAMSGVPEEARERMRSMMEEGRRRMAEAHEKMEQARKKFQEMEERIKKLEAEVERLKAGR